MVLVRRRGGGGRSAVIIKDEPIASGVVQRRIVHARVHDRTHDFFEESIRRRIEEEEVLFNNMSFFSPFRFYKFEELFPSFFVNRVI